MTKYNFRKFFYNTIVHNSEYVSNGYFLVKTLILTKKQLQIINSFSSNEELTNRLVNNVLKPLVDKYGNNKGIEFIPGCIDQNNKNVYMVNDNRITCLKAEYYHWLTSRKCNLYIVGDQKDPLFVYKNNEFVGILLPVKVRNFTVNDKIDYQKWLQKQKQKAAQPKEYVIGKCVHVSGIECKHVKLIKNIDNYQFYALKNQTNKYDKAYIKVGQYLYPLCYIQQINEAVNKIKTENMDILKEIEKNLNNRLKNNLIVSLGDAEMFGRLEEAKEHNRRIKQQ